LYQNLISLAIRWQGDLQPGNQYRSNHAEKQIQPIENKGRMFSQYQMIESVEESETNSHTKNVPKHNGKV
jgi:hypothetical protein